MPFKSEFFRRFFAAMMLIIAMMLIALYSISVPMVQSKVYEIELDASRTALNNVAILANKMYADVAKYKPQAIDIHKKNLVSRLDFTEAYIEDAFASGLARGQSRPEIRKQILRFLRASFEGSYIWVADYDHNIISHPDPRYNGVNTDTLEDRNPHKVLNRLIRETREQGEGFFQYPWHHLNQAQSATKLSFVKDLKQHGFIIGTGVFLDDIDQQVERLRLTAIDEIRGALSKIVIAKTGYLFIFNQQGKLLAHPNPLLDQTQAMHLINPVTGASILSDMIATSDSDQELHYMWDKADDPLNYTYEKVSLTRSIEGFDWYISATAYQDELRSSANQLSTGILFAALVSLIIALILSFIFARRITQPIQILANTAERVREGDLSACSNITRQDELGQLAQTFDSMVEQLRDSIDSLDIKVQERSQALSELEQRQRLILDALPVYIAYIDCDLKYRYVNSAYAPLFGHDENSMLGYCVVDIIGADLYAQYQQPLLDGLQGQLNSFDNEVYIGDLHMSCRNNIIPVYDEQGEVIGLIALTIDVTAERAASNQLVELQRIHATGQLAGGLAHDYNNLLTVILGNLLIAEERHGGDPKLAALLAPAIRASRRGAQITDRLLAFSRRKPLNPQVVNIHSELKETIKLVRSALPAHIEIQYEDAAEDVHSNIDSAQLENALINLSLNAKDAIGDTGTGLLRFSLRKRYIGTFIYYDERVSTGDYVEIIVEDSGHGFDADALEHAFEPFFTTKSSGKGSGLGLSMIYGFIKQSSGYIDIQNIGSRGARISLLLPLCEQPLATVAPLTVESLPSRNLSSTLVLLVEDEDDVRLIVRQHLVDMGCHVIEATNSDEAEALIHSGTNFDILLSDVSMPGRLDGFGLASLCVERLGIDNIILMSGYAMATRRPEHQKFTLLGKPFERHALEAALSQSK